MIETKKCKKCGQKFRILKAKIKSLEDDYCLDCHNISFYTTTSRPWIDESTRMLNKTKIINGDVERKIGETMADSKDREMRYSRKTREYEYARKKEIMDYKPTWVKRGRNTKELDHIVK